MQVLDAGGFVDYYGLLGLSPDATADELGHRFHRLAKRYHPDNPATGDRARFDTLVEAHNVLKDSARRASYDALYERMTGPRNPSAPQEAANGQVGRDVEIQERLLATYYARRRQNIREPGVPEFDLERLFGCPVEDLEFHLWYLKAKRWIERLDNGMYAITVEGIDHVNAEHHRKTATRLLMDHTQAEGGAA